MFADFSPLEWAATSAGLAGTGCVVGAYLALQLGWLAAQSWRYNLLNLFGAIGIALSLLVHFNLASMIIQLFWMGASLVGIVRLIKTRRQA